MKVSKNYQNLGRTLEVDNPTQQFMLNEFQAVVDIFRNTFFSSLPDCMLTLDASRRSTMGYFRPNSFVSKDGTVVHQIALNPSYVLTHPPEEAFQTIAHEMTHQYVYDVLGQTKSNGYHCKKFATKMEEIGLIPSSTGKPGGRKTGYRMSDYMQEGGCFQKVCRELIESGLCLSWGSTRPKAKAAISSKAKGKVKFSCPVCSNVCWAASSRNLVCGDHMIQMQKKT